MFTLPAELITLLLPFAPLFSPSVLQHIHTLVAGAILTIGPRTISAALRAVGLSHTRHFQNYHRVLNRCQWSPREAARILLRLLIKTFVPTGPLVFGLDDTLERRRGAKRQAKGIYRDPVRSSQGHFVKASGLRWLSLMLLAPVPFAQRVWALPFLTVLCPSQRYWQAHRPQCQQHKKLTDWARQMLLQLRRWLPERPVIVVADSSFAVLELLHAWQQMARPVVCITRLRLDAALYNPAPPRQPRQNGRPRLKGKRLPILQQQLSDPDIEWTEVVVKQWTGRMPRHAHKCATSPAGLHAVEIATGTAVWYHTGMPPVPVRWVLIRDPAGQSQPQALLCTEAEIDAQQIVCWYAQRWAVEVTFREVRDHLGVETQRQWNDTAIARTTPVLLGLFSMVTLLAHRLVEQNAPAVHAFKVRQSAWYVKEQATFSDALAWVRRHLWSHAQTPFYTSQVKADREKLQQQLLERMTDLLCYAA
jgi:hypothetical protein